MGAREARGAFPANVPLRGQLGTSCSWGFTAASPAAKWGLCQPRLSAPARPTRLPRPAAGTSPFLPEPACKLVLSEMELLGWQDSRHGSRVRPASLLPARDRHLVMLLIKTVALGDREQVKNSAVIFPNRNLILEVLTEAGLARKTGTPK